MAPIFLSELYTPTETVSSVNAAFSNSFYRTNSFSNFIARRDLFNTVSIFSNGWCRHQLNLLNSVMNVKHKRQGQMDIESCYFYTDTINDFKHLLKDDEFKTFCINSWKYLNDNDFIKIYGFVIMPNHIHLLWNMIKLNGK